MCDWCLFLLKVITDGKLTFWQNESCHDSSKGQETFSNPL